MRILSLFAALTCAVFASGCAGYRVGPVKPLVMENVESLSVPTFENDTLIPRLEVLAANSVIKQIQQDGTFKVTGSEKADAIVEGKLTQIRRRGARSVRGDVMASKEYRLRIELEYTVTNRVTGERLMHGRIAGSTSFFVSGNDVNQDERQAIPLALEDAATRLVSRLSEGW